MRATVELPPSVAIVESLLEGFVQANVLLIESGLVPPSPLDANVRYQREASGFEEWQLAMYVVRSGRGDCEDLNGWAAAYRRTTDDPGARAILYRTGPHLFHCVCLLSSGEIYDVCPTLGMKTSSSNHRLPGRASRDASVDASGYGYGSRR
jgi:hypothetical protein